MAYTANKVINDLEAKATPVDADVLVVGDSADTNRAKKTTWAQIKTVLGSTFGTISSPTFTGTVTTPAIIVSSETASTIASFDASKNIKSLAVATYPSLTELSYVKGVTSALQTQITAKAPSTAPTFATSITGSYFTPSEILITDGSKNIVSAAVATYPSLTELSYVKGVTSAIQTQLSAIDTSLLQGVGVTTVAKTYWNFEIPFLVSTNVPSGDFWTTTSIDPLAGSMSYARLFPSGDVANSIITVSAIFANFGSTAGGIKFDTTKKVIVEFMVELGAAGTEQMGFGLVESVAPFSDYDDASVDAACFTIDTAGALYGHTSAGGGTTLHTETLITGITLTNANTYRIEFDPGVDVKFYVNGVLKATNTTNIPSTAQFILFGAGSQGNTSSNGDILITAPQFAIEK